MTTNDTRDYYTDLIPGAPRDGDPNATRPIWTGPVPAPPAGPQPAEPAYVVSEQGPRLADEFLNQAPASKPRKPLRKRWSVRIPVLATAGLIAIIAASGGHSHPAASVTPAKPAVTAPAHKAPAHKAVKPVQAQAPVTTAPPAPAVSSAPAQPPAAPAGPTASQQQALSSAQGYVSDGQGFSRQGLIDQLTFEKFSVADATYAANNSGANWYDQAVTSAKGYMSDGQGFSRGSLIDQLTFEKFTYAQASYAAGKVGL